MDAVSAPHRRPALIILVIVAALTCLGLGWWQWSRFESSNGTAQNLGYALQWPLFAGFVVFAYFRFVRLERETDDEAADDERPATAAATTDERSTPPASDRPRPRRKPTRKAVAPREIPPDLLPPRPTAPPDDDPVLAEYNRYLAELNAHDLHRQMQTAGLTERDPERSAG